MKKAKFLFVAVTVLAIVGGSLAFNTRVLRTVYCTSQASPHACIAGAGIFSTTTTDVSVPEWDCSFVSNPSGACGNKGRFVFNP